MSLTQDYLRLYTAFARAGGGQSVKVTSDRLASALYCTARNAKLIIHKMTKLGWLDYRPGRGRGNPSELTFRLDYEETYVREAKRLAGEGKVEAAFQLVQAFGGNTGFRQEQFVEWLSGYFGYSVDNRNEAYLETLKLPVFRELNGVHTLDPAESFYALDMHLIQQVYDTLVETDPVTGGFKGAIAHHWSSDDSAKEWTFYLRKGVLFHNGRELTAEDVRFSLLRLAEGGYKQRWLAEDIVSVDILSKFAVSVRLKRPNRLFPAYAGYPPMSIVPLECGETGLSDKPVGTGPYRYVAQDSQRYVLEAFDRHYAGRALIDRIELTVIPGDWRLALTPSASLLIDTDDIPVSEPVSLPDWRLKRKVTGCTLLTMNQRKPGPLRDLHLRKAVQYAVNRRLMVDELGHSRACPAFGFFAEDGQGGLVDTDWDMKLARGHMEKSSYAGEPLRLLTYRRHVKDAEWLQRELAAIGIRFEVQIVSWKQLLQTSVMERADMILFELPSAEGIIRIVESFKSHFIRAHLSEDDASAADEAVAELLAAADERCRSEILKRIERNLKEKAAFAFLVHKSVSSHAHPSLRGIRINGRGWIDFKTLWYDPERTSAAGDGQKAKSGAYLYPFSDG